ncbi:MAG: fimbrillin family protein [Prevotellaceae bacterium]|jgi:hypothetical protein|nr:fimbrillin family protein [Prevotellaceae bacterium]
MTRLVSVLCALSLPLLVACTDGETDGTQFPDGKYPVAFSARIDDTLTRATAGGTWTGDEEVAVRIGDKVTTYTANADFTLTSSAPFYWQSATETKQVLAWYPNSTLSSGWTTTADQSTSTAYQACDFIAATATLSYPGSTPSTLNFMHLTSKVSVDIKSTDGVDLTGASVKLLGLYTVADIVETGGKLTLQTQAGATPAAITPLKLVTPATGYALSYDALLVPQTKPAAAFIEITTADDTRYTYTPTQALTFEGGKRTSFLIDVKEGYLVVSVEGSTTWGETATGETASQELIYVRNEADLRAAISSDVGGTGKLYWLMNDIDLDGTNMTTSNTFYGTFDGRGHTISNFRADDGLFNKTSASGKIMNLTIGGNVITNNDRACFLNENHGTIERCTFIGTKNNKEISAAICRDNYGTILSCENKGTLTGTNMVTGICYENDLKGIIIGCHNSGTISVSANFASGICSDNLGTIRACTNSGDITATNSNAAGICISNDGAIQACQNIGSVKSNGATDSLIFGNYAYATANYYYRGSSSSGTKFSATAWPTSSLAGWSLYDGTTGNWKTLGGWNDGVPEFPKLWWE